MKKFENDLILRVLKGQKSERVPVWLMRQAGRYLPEYRAIRAKYDFLTMCKTPEIASEVTIQPVDIIGVDAAIIFSDILVIPEAMGMKLLVEEGRGGPRLLDPLRTSSDIARVHIADSEKDLSYVAEAIKLTVARLNGRVPLIGFSGAPWTLMAYMVEGKGGDFVRARALLYEEPLLAHQLLRKITDSIISYLRMQCNAGADVLQIFDTWAGVLSKEQYEEFSLEYVKEIIDSVKTYAPVIVFPKGVNRLLREISHCGADAVSIDWTVPIDIAGIEISQVVQGNLDPAILFASKDTIVRHTNHILRTAPRGRHIFNLGHGIMPGTPLENVKDLVEFVRNFYH
ncbi:MAG: uroporphyrinogen decarboxylase [Candidatus Kryptoniota bacterium]